LIVSGGVGIAKSLTVKGNISCAGTVFYEDVTNIDSVGIITAQSGIVVSGGEVKVGSAITISSTAGVITATSYYGDGSNLSNITSTTINNNADKTPKIKNFNKIN